MTAEFSAALSAQAISADSAQRPEGIEAEALVLANVEAHQFTRAELEATRRFGGDRGD